VSDQKQIRGPNDLLYYAPRALRERAGDSVSTGNEEGAADTAATHNGALPYPVGGLRARKPSDIFPEQTIKGELQRFDREARDLPSLLQGRSVGALAKVAIAAAGAAFVTLAFVVVVSPPSQQLMEGIALPAWSRPTSPTVPATVNKTATKLIVRDKSAIINEPLELGVTVDAAAPGAAVVIKGLPAGARLTAGNRIGADEWRVAAEQISDVAVVPARDFVGKLDLSAELHMANQAALVTAFFRLSWTPAPFPGVASASTSSLPEPSAPVARQLQALTSSPPAGAADAAPQARLEPTHELSPNEIAGLIRRAQENLATGDIQEARALLLKAATAHDARAALLLAKTFDPTTLRKFGVGDPGLDLAQARNWYQRAKEWGSPDAQLKLDALASYPRR
jgi:hypothetical protein